MLYPIGTSFTFSKRPPFVRMDVKVAEVKVSRLYKPGTRVLLVNKIDEVLQVNVRIGVAAV